MIRLSKKVRLIVLLSLILSPISYFVIFHQFSENFYKAQNTIIVSVNAIPEFEVDDLPSIKYPELNELWYHSKIEMLIIINDSTYLDAVQPLVEWKNYKGVKTIVLYNYSSYEGRDKSEKIRNMIKSYYLSDQIRWVLLAGDAEENLIPTRYVYNPDTAEIDGESESVGGNEYFKPTDFYYADLTGSWDDNNNNIFGESAFYSGSVDEISWIPEVYVGRLPAESPNELSLMVNKSLDYEKAVNIGDWMNKMLLAGGISDTIAQEPPDGEDESILTTYIWQNYAQYQMNFTHLWRSTYYTPPDPKEPLTSTSFETRMNEGHSTVIFAGHGAYNLYSDALSSLYSNSEALNIINTDMPSFIYADACTTAPFDVESVDDNIGEILIKKENAGAIGYIGGSRVTWYWTDDANLEKLNRGNAKLFWKEFFEEKKYQPGMALYDSKISYLNSDYFNQPSTSIEQEWERKNVLTYNLLGDPEIDIFTDKPHDATNSFEGIFYEGQLVSLQIKDIYQNSIPRARINLRTEDGKNRTIYADKDGIANFRLPAQANENYSVLLTGHNLNPSIYNFSTSVDSNPPVISEVNFFPNTPTISDNIEFTIETMDNQSGIESVFIIISKSNVNGFNIYTLPNNFQENKSIFHLKLNKLDPGIYSYMIIARDYCNKTTISYEDSYHFTIPTPMGNYALTIMVVIIIGLVGISSVLLTFNFWKIRRLSSELGFN